MYGNFILLFIYNTVNSTNIFLSKRKKALCVAIRMPFQNSKIGIEYMNVILFFYSNDPAERMKFHKYANDGFFIRGYDREKRCESIAVPMNFISGW